MSYTERTKPEHYTEYIHTATLYYPISWPDKTALRSIYAVKRANDQAPIKCTLTLFDGIDSYFYLEKCRYLYFKINFCRSYSLYRSSEERIRFVHEIISERLSSLIRGFDINKLRLNRLDYKIDILIPKDELRKMYLCLLNKGYERYGRMVNGNYSTSQYFSGKSVGLNNYDKKDQFLNSNKPVDIGPFMLPNGLDFVRLEAQVKMPHLQYRRTKYNVQNTIENYFTRDYWLLFFEKYMRPVLLDGFYVKEQDARYILGESFPKYGMAEKILNFMLDIKDQGMDAIKKLNPSRFYSYMDKLKQIGLNPIPLPSDSKYRYLPNLYDAALQIFDDANYNILDHITLEERKTEPISVGG